MAVEPIIDALELAWGRQVTGEADDPPGTYVGCFANEYGEQAVYTYHYTTDEAALRIGDAGWHDARRVEDGHAEGVVLTQSEALWLRACWVATGGVKRNP